MEFQIFHPSDTSMEIADKLNANFALLTPANAPHTDEQPGSPDEARAKLNLGAA